MTRTVEQAPTPPDQIDIATAVAIHEGGHVWLADHCGMRTRWAYIKRHWNGTVSGGTEIWCQDYFDQLEDPETQRQVLLLTVAGIAATTMWMQRVHHWPGRDARGFGCGSGCEDRKVFRLESRGTGYSFDRAVADVEPILDRGWDRIVRFGDLLALRRKVLASRA